MTERPDLRAEPRIAVTCTGRLTLNGKTSPCEIVNMCSRGFLIRAREDLPIGQMLDLCCDFGNGRNICCKVQVRHVNRECLGAKVLEIGEEEQLACLQFIAERRPGDKPRPGLAA